jgi:cell division transport system permease protein
VTAILPRRGRRPQPGAAGESGGSSEGEDRGALSPIVPPQSIAGRTLTLVIAIMTFLASLTIGAVSAVDEAAEAWLSDIGREVTIEVRRQAGADLDEQIARAVALAQEFPGVGGARAVTDEETRRLLEPWLGAGVDLSALPVPRLVVVTIDDPATFDVAGLSAAVARDIIGGTLDDHEAWVDRLAAAARSMVGGGLAVLVLVLVAMALSVVFATRAAMAGNRHIIEVLHFCGAEDRFIATEFQRHFLLLGARGGAIGGMLAMAVFVGLDLVFGGGGLGSTGQLDSLLGEFQLGWTAYAAVAVLVVAVAALTAVTSRLAVRQSLAAVE